jgi:protein translocase SecG subunit
MIDKILLISQITISILLGLLILVQNKEGGLGQAFGGGSEGFTATKRGAEKVIFISTVVMAVLFLANAFAFVIF